MILTDAKLSRLARTHSSKATRYISDPAMKGLQIRVVANRIRFCFRYRINGQQRNVTLGPYPELSLKLAREKAIEISRCVLIGTDPHDEKQKNKSIPTLSEFFWEHYVPNVKHQKRSWELDVSAFRNHLEEPFGRKCTNQITPLQIKRFTDQKIAQGYAKGMINRILILLSGIYTKAKKWRFVGIQDREALGIELLPNANQINRYLSNEELERLFISIKKTKCPMARFIITFLLLTGARKRECFMAKWQDFDLERGLWTIPENKSGKPRVVTLSKAVVGLMKELQAAHSAARPDNPSDYAFCNFRTGRPYHHFYQTWNRIRIRAGIEDFRMHDLRHSFASVLVSNGVSLYEVQALLGHSSPRTTMRYAHLSHERLKLSAEVAATAFNL